MRVNLFLEFWYRVELITEKDGEFKGYSGVSVELL